VILSLHSGRLIDRLGYKKVVGRGAIVTAIFAIVRIYDDSFWALLAGQVGIAAAQPYVNNGISKLVSEWFDESRGAIATGVGTIGMFLGMAVAMAWTPALVASTSLKTAMIVFAAIAALSAVTFLLVAKEAPGAASAHAAASKSFGELVRDRDLAIIFALSFLGLGFFNGLTTWLEQILAPNGIDSEQAGFVGGLLIVGGIAGAAVIPLVSDKLQRRKPFVLACTAAATVVLHPLCTGRHLPSLLVLGGVMGFFFLPAYALLLEMCSELAGPLSAGYATGILMLAGNAGGVVVIVAMQLVRGDAPTYLRAVWLLLGLLVVAFALAAMVSETYQRKIDASRVVALGAK
jgi:cyanate permease